MNNNIILYERYARLMKHKAKILEYEQCLTKFIIADMTERNLPAFGQRALGYFSLNKADSAELKVATNISLDYKPCRICRNGKETELSQLKRFIEIEKDC